MRPTNASVILLHHCRLGDGKRRSVYQGAAALGAIQQAAATLCRPDAAAAATATAASLRLLHEGGVVGREVQVVLRNQAARLPPPAAALRQVLLQ